MENNELTNGQKLVGINFNPGGREDVNLAKELSAKLIDMVQEKHDAVTDNGKAMASHNRNILRTNAVNKMIEAQMMVVKYLTWED